MDISKVELGIKNFFTDLLLTLIHNARRGEVDIALNFGLTIDNVTSLLSLQTNHISLLAHRLAKNSLKSKSWELNPKTFGWLLDQIKEDMGTEVMMEEFIRRGATTAEMIEFFGINSIQCANLSKMLGVKKSVGRKAAITEETKDEIYESYLNSLDIHDERVRTLHIAKQTNQTIHAVCLTVEGMIHRPSDSMSSKRLAKAN